MGENLNINDVRKALFDAYVKLLDTEQGIEGKMSEGHIAVHYPTFWDCETVEEFSEPYCIEIYSYALGPSRTHYVRKGKKDKKTQYYEWESPDIYKKAVEVINSWVENI